MLISKEQHRRPPAKKLEEEPDKKIRGLTGKSPRYGKTKTYFNKPRKWLMRMILKEQENVFVFKFRLTVPPVLNVYFNIIYADVVFPPGEKLSLFTHLCSNQRFS